MNFEYIQKILAEFKEGKTDMSEVMGKISQFEDGIEGHFCWDDNRMERQGRPEAVFGLNKTTEQVMKIASNLITQDKPFLITKLDKEKADNLLETFPLLVYHNEANVISYGSLPQKCSGRVGIVTAGVADVSIASEAEVTLRFLGNEVSCFYDRGVAGVHRLFAILPELQKCDVCIAVAGMEGALPTVISGLFSGPVIGLPVSTGYGTSFSGLTALFSMLNSCADKLVVVNINNGYGAACAADAILRIGATCK